ncbi:3-oxoacyl-ACP reductase FabG [Paenibacillus sp.]|jgi:3-oxoacyl-[acyl-carrier protein] reductase|uniref:3-oxoacyl-ACP reductase FabG n=1 Tax=Paenibacillus sp. TaxID=58172 RepID=UPI002828A090|nr:3-oxoacyl-ACP reductase FabG [Paenibacillus sp.]MDR0270563.1 3-oxoacyl-ACP reductase FabG [Paenibacillus sp.]
MRLEGKIAVITGAAGGIGWAAVRLFLAHGAQVVAADFNAEAGRKLIEELDEEQRQRVCFIKTDVSDEGSVQALIESVITEYGCIDILINNAGITRDAMLSKMTTEQWKQVIDVNLSGVYYCTKYAAPHMTARGQGKIINTSSIVGLQGNLGQTNYAATKAGVIGMTKTWARELGFKGVCVNAVAPGFIATEMVAKMPEKVVSAMSEKVPLRRLGLPEDVAEAYLYLASDAANYVNGAVLEVNGGLNI